MTGDHAQAVRVQIVALEQFMRIRTEIQRSRQPLAQSQIR